MRQEIIFILVLAIISVKAEAQPSHAAPILQELRKPLPDSTRSRLLLQLGTEYLERIGELPSDLDSALLFARESDRICRKDNDSAGAEAATLLTGRIYSEAKQYDRAESLLPLLSDDGRVMLLQAIILYRINTNGNDWRDADSAVHLCQQLIELSHKRKMVFEEGVGWLHLGVCYYWLNRNLAARDAILRGWAMHERQKDITYELTYLSAAAHWSGKDSGFDGELRKMRHTAQQDAIAILRADTNKDMKRQAIRYFNNIGSSYRIANRMDLALEVAREAIQLGRTLDPYFPYPLYFLSGLELTEGDLKGALQHALEAVRLIESAPGPVRDGVGYEAAGRVYLALDDLPKSLDYYRKAMAVYFAHPSLAINKAGPREITSVYLRMGRPAEALAFLDTAEQKLRFTRDIDLNFITEGRGDCYFALHRYDEAEKCYLQSLHNGNTRYRYTTFADYGSLVKVYAAKGQYRKAIPYLTALTADSNSFQVGWERRSNALFQFYQADSALGDFRQAVAHLRQYQRLKDSALNDSTGRQLQEMTAKYETEKKDKNIARLDTEAKLRDTELSRGRTLRNALIAVAVLLVLLVGVLYNRYLFRQRSNRLLKEMNGRQYQLILEKEWLMREIHHRVKNNLQLLISLLNMQAATLKDELALSAFEEIRSRIRAISLIHQKLYQEKIDAAHINMQEYITQLISFLQDGIDRARRVRFRIVVDLPDLDVGRCVPVGLILNEAITNAIKYAFPEGDDASLTEYPNIDVELKRTDNDSIRLLIADNGVGLPAGVDLHGSGSMGMQLIQALTLQLNGILTLEGNPGFRILVVFPMDPVHDETAQALVEKESFI